jgi:DNA invertase Pin-like site-specific DNA recombinase
MRVGYAWVSRRNLRLEPQRDTLLADGCERVSGEKVSSRMADRTALREALDYGRARDVLVVARLDQPGRSLREPIGLLGRLKDC